MRRGAGASLPALLLCLAAATIHAQTPDRLTATEKAAGWRLLFDGTTLTGWRGLGLDTVPSAHWQVDRGAIRKVPAALVAKGPDGKPVSGADLMTVDSFTDFEFAFEWKVAPGANSGVKYNVSEQFSRAHGSSHAALGFEYQVEDDSLGDDITVESHRAAALYDLMAPNALKALRPVGQWNTGRIVFRGNHGEQWLNGAKVLDFELGSPHFDSLVSTSKYRTIPGFADRRTGHIVLQDHNDEAWYRNLRIRVFDH